MLQQRKKKILRLACLAGCFAVVFGTHAAGAAGSRPVSVPEPIATERNNAGETGHWHLGNVDGRALLALDGRLAVGGWFTIAGGIESPGIAYWDGQDWLGAGDEYFNGAVSSLAYYDDQLIAGGQFTRCGARDLAYLAMTDDDVHWQGFPVAGPDNDVWALTTFSEGGQDYLIVGGSFANASGSAVNAITRWNGDAWQPMGDGFTWTDQGGVARTGIVYALYVFEGELYAGGAFTHSGDVEVNHFAHWTGVAWEPVDDGFDAPVMAIGEYAGRLIVGGHFVIAGGELVFYVAELAQGEWNAIARGTNGAVYSLETFSGNLIVGGEFDEAGGINCPHVARWNGYDWLSVGAGLADNRVYGLEVFDGELYATGAFTVSQELTTNRIARWEPLHWLPLGTGLEGAIFVPDPDPGSDPEGELNQFHVNQGNPADISISIRNQPGGVYVVTYSLPEPAAVSLDLVDASGRWIAPVASGFSGAGSHDLTWQPESIGKGLYFLCLRSGGRVSATRVAVPR